MVMDKKKSINKKIAIIISFKDFRDEEYFIPKDIFTKAGFEIKTFSNRLGIALGVNGGEVLVDMTLAEIEVDQYDAIIFTGGPGALKYLDNEDSYKIINKTVEKNKILGSLCISPIILAKSQILRGKKATVWTSLMDKSAVKILKQYGAFYDSNKVVEDGRIITADGPSSAILFAEEIIKAIY